MTTTNERLFRVSVDLPADTGRGARESLFTTILDAAIEWETEHLDGWDVAVHSTVVSVACECPCDTCVETIGYDPETPCPACPVHGISDE